MFGATLEKCAVKGRPVKKAKPTKSSVLWPFRAMLETQHHQQQISAS
jgi:hypothetical protein